MEMIETKEAAERYLLVACDTGDSAETEESLKELAELVKTAGGVAVSHLVQPREKPNPGYYVGTGKAEEIKNLIEPLELDGIVCDDELTPAQHQNLAELLGCKVIDRTVLILDIFAMRAQSAEGKCEVELAQLIYRSAHLKGLGTSLSRLGGGIGTRGPGETKLESDRRAIRRRIDALKGELEDIRLHRERTRKKRQGGDVKTAALVGYTNAGKSTLLNKLTDAGIYADDALFATLDTTTRSLELPKGSRILLTDTVGFIKKLPHALIKAFRSTLEEVLEADLICHVADASNPQLLRQAETVRETLKSLGAEGIPQFLIYNKIDKDVPAENLLAGAGAERTFRVSAATGEGLDGLLEALEDFALSGKKRFAGVLPYSAAGLSARIRNEGILEAEEYRAEGLYVEALVPERLYAALSAAAGEC